MIRPKCLGSWSAALVAVFWLEGCGTCRGDACADADGDGDTIGTESTDAPGEPADECSDDNDEFETACLLVSGQTIEGTARDGDVDNDVFYIEPRTARGGLLIALEHGEPNAESAFTERVFVGTQPPRLLDAIAPPPGVLTERRVGARAGTSYYVALRTDADSSYRLTLTYEDALYELEPNDAPSIADDLGEAVHVRGGANEGSANDIDYFRVQAPEGKRALGVVLTHVKRVVTSEFELLFHAADAPNEELDEGFVEAGTPLDREIGVVPGRAYLLQVRNWSGSSHEYELALTWSERLRELEPNDTAEQAHALAPGETVRGNARSQTKDDVDTFTVVAPEAVTRGLVTLAHVSDSARSRFVVTVLDEAGTALATDDATARPIALALAAVPGERYDVRVETVAGGPFEYDLTVAFE